MPAPESVEFIEEVFRKEAVELRLSRERCRIIHKTRDTDTAGNEVEVSVRSFLRRMLPSKYTVTHGHIVDSVGNTSPQLDIIICDQLETSSFFVAEDGTEYVPYESVYAVGEVKSTYYKREKPFEKFADTIKKIKQVFVREDVTITEPFRGMRVRTELGRNPLLSFMVFVNGGTFAPGHIKDFFNVTDDVFLPSFSVFLNKGMLIRTQSIAGDPSGGRAMAQLPEWCTQEVNQNAEWDFLTPLDQDVGAVGTQALASLYYSLLQPLRKIELSSPDTKEYIENILNIDWVSTNLNEDE